MNSIGGIFVTSFLIAFSGAVAPGPVLTVTISESARRGFWAGPLIILGHGILEFFLFIAVARGAGQFLTLPTVKATISLLGGAVLMWLGAVMARQSYRTQIPLTDTCTGQSEGASDTSASAGVIIQSPSPQPSPPGEKELIGQVLPASPVSREGESEGLVSGTSDTSVTSAFAGPTAPSAPSYTWADLASNPVFAGFLLSISNPYWTIWWATIGVGYIALSLPFGRWGLTSFYCGHILADLIWYSFISGFIALGKKSFSPKIYRFIILLCGVFLLIFGIYFLYSGFHFLFQ